MSRLQRRRSLLFVAVAYYASACSAFQSPYAHTSCHRRHETRQRQCPPIAMTASTDNVDVATPIAAPPQERDSKTSLSGACYYKRIDGPWRPRKELSSLAIGERLFATRLQKCDLLDGKTGPKVFFECGVGRRSDNGKWSIANGMFRLGKRGMKPGVMRKKVKKIPADSLMEVYVSKISLEHGSFEVCLTRDEAMEKGSARGKIPASSLKAGDELTGIVKQVFDYGVFVDVNANRNGLLHISRVAKQRDAYIKKEEGLKKVGLGRGSYVNVIVISNDKKRLELDLAPPVVEEEIPVNDVEDDDNDDVLDDEAAMWAAYGDADEGNAGSDVGEDEAAMWAAYAVDDSNGDEDEDEYDEDEDIEDALGIGSY